jgi:hypothetical protein
MSKLFVLITLGIFMFTSCNDKGTACTEEFRTITISVTGGTLSKVYTVRQSTKDTIYSDQSGAFGNSTYVVLDDAYHSRLKNQKDDFLFIGEVDGNLVIEEMFTIEADECHIQYVSGNTDIEL